MKPIEVMARRKSIQETLVVPRFKLKLGAASPYMASVREAISHRPVWFG